MRFPHTRSINTVVTALCAMAAAFTVLLLAADPALAANDTTCASGFSATGGDGNGLTPATGSIYLQGISADTLSGSDTVSEDSVGSPLIPPTTGDTQSVRLVGHRGGFGSCRRQDSNLRPPGSSAHGALVH